VSKIVHLKKVLNWLHPKYYRFRVYYIIRYFVYLYYKITKFPEPKHYLSIVAIFKNEADYIAEWLEYHLLVGVQKFYLYDNESTDNVKDILDPYIKVGIVEYKYWTGKAQQKKVYLDSLKKVYKETYWVAAIDIDEFIVPVVNDTLSEFLKDFEQYPGVQINWVTYGSSGKKSKEDGLVIERFKDHSFFENDNNNYVKTISNTRYLVYFTIHTAKYVFEKVAVDSDKNKRDIFFHNRKGLFDKIRVNHYQTKSYEEFWTRKRLGRVSNGNEYPTDDSFFHSLDHNDVKNDTIIDKYVALIKNNIEKRKG